MTASVLQDLEPVLARAMTGEYDCNTAVLAVCTAIERRGIACGLVRPAGEGRNEAIVSGGERAARETDLLATVARLTAPHRAYHTPNDDRWNELFGGNEMLRARASWLACEPVVSSSGSHVAVLVLIGESESHRDEVLLALPAVARACAALLGQEHRFSRIEQITHVMNNLLTSIIVNVSYASHLVEEQDGAATLPGPAETREAARVDLVQALQHSTDAAKQLAAQVLEIAKLGRSGSGK
jgi:hypothetical protein